VGSADDHFHDLRFWTIAERSGVTVQKHYGKKNNAFNPALEAFSWQLQKTFPIFQISVSLRCL
jgi:hypothetical protein